MTRKNNLFTLIIKMQILFTHAIITPTACASSVFLSSYDLSQSAHVFSLDYLLKDGKSMKQPAKAEHAAVFICFDPLP